MIQNAVRNYDVRVSRWSSKTVKNESLSHNFPSKEEKKIYRQVTDLDQEKSLIVTRSFVVDEQTEKHARKETLARSLVFFENGKVIRRSLLNAPDSGRPQAQTFAQFCRGENLERPALMGYYFVHMPVDYTRVDAVLAALGRPDNDSFLLNTMGDGMLRVSSAPKPGQTIRVTNWIDPIRLVTVKQTSLRFSSGTWTPNFSHDVEYEERDSLYLPIRITYSATVGLPNPSNPSQALAISDEVGTIELEWYQVNAKELKFPDLKELGASAADWERFVNQKKAESTAAKK